MILPPPDRKHARLPRSKVHPGENARTDITPQSLEALIENLRAIGQQVDVIVYPHPALPDEWMLADGHRRWTALGLVPCEWIEATLLAAKPDPTNLLVIQLSLGSTAEKLNPFDLAAGFLKLMRDLNLTQDAVARLTGNSPSKVSKCLAIADGAAPALRPLIEAGEIPFSSAAALGRLKADHPAQLELAELIRQGRLTRDAVEAEVARRLRGCPKPPPPKSIQGKADGRRFEIGLAAGDTVDAVIDWLKAVAARLAKHREVPPDQLGFLFAK